MAKPKSPREKTTDKNDRDKINRICKQTKKHFISQQSSYTDNFLFDSIRKIRDSTYLDKLATIKRFAGKKLHKKKHIQ